MAVVLVLGWMLIISGLVQGLGLIGAGQVPHFWLQLVSVVLAVFIGFLFIRNPGEAALTLALLLVVFFMVEGISKIIFALTIRPFPAWGWVLASGVLGVVLSIILLNTAAAAVWLLGLLVGIQLISGGASLFHLAWRVRGEA